MADPIVDFFLSLTKPRKPEDGDPMALSPLAGLVEPPKRPKLPIPARSLDTRQLSPMAGLEAPQAAPKPSNPIVNARGSVAETARARLAAVGRTAAAGAPSDGIDPYADSSGVDWIDKARDFAKEVVQPWRMPSMPSRKARPAPPDDAQVRARAAKEFASTGLTSEQSAGYVPVVSDFLHRAIDPRGDYYFEGDALRKLEGIVPDFFDQELQGARGRWNVEPLEQGWRMYLGMPQTDEAYGISEYMPTKAKGTAPYYYRVNDFMGRLAGEFGQSPPEIVRWINENIDRNGGKHMFHATGLGDHTWTRGKDSNGPYLSYYDKWDLAPTISEGTTLPVGKLIGKPFEIYDRIYYDPVTFEPIDPKQPKRK